MDNLVQTCEEELREDSRLADTEKADIATSKNDLKKEKLSKRIWEIDFIRGMCVLLMIFDHLMFDVSNFGYEWASSLGFGNWFVRLGNFADWYWDWGVREIVRYVVVSLFFITSGISSSFSRSNAKRGFKLAIFAIGITVVTAVAEWVMEVDVTILFGVIHCFAVSILLYSLLELLKFNKIMLGIVAIIFVVSGIVVDSMNLTFSNNFFMFFGVTVNSFNSADYFPIIPWAGVFLVGVVLGKLLYKERKSILPKLNGRWNTAIKFVGRNALIIYVVHQVVMFGIFYLIGMIFGWN